MASLAKWAAVAIVTAGAVQACVTGVAAAASRDTDDTPGGPVVSFDGTSGGQIANVRLGWVNGLLTGGALRFVQEEVAGLGRGDRQGTANVDLGSQSTTADCMGESRNSLAQVDLTPVWGLAFGGHPRTECTRPSLADQITGRVRR